MKRTTTKIQNAKYELDDEQMLTELHIYGSIMFYKDFLSIKINNFEVKQRVITETKIKFFKCHKSQKLTMNLV